MNMYGLLEIHSFPKGWVKSWVFIRKEGWDLELDYKEAPRKGIMKQMIIKRWSQTCLILNNH